MEFNVSAEVSYLITTSFLLGYVFGVCSISLVWSEIVLTMRSSQLCWDQGANWSEEDQFSSFR